MRVGTSFRPVEAVGFGFGGMRLRMQACRSPCASSIQPFPFPVDPVDPVDSVAEPSLNPKSIPPKTTGGMPGIRSRAVSHGQILGRAGV